jgi:hypothetical protein
VVNLEDGTATYNERIFDVGLGIPSGAVTLGESILMPGAGIDPDDDLCPPEHPDYPDCKPCEDKLCDSLTETKFLIYWREPGVDRL